MKRTLVTTMEHDSSTAGVTYIRVLQDFNTVTEARKWLSEKAPEGTYSILNQIEADLKVNVEEVRRTGILRGAQFIERTRKPKETTNDPR